jgi:hypothetical protein
MAISFDGPNKLIVLSAGTVELDVKDLYSRWKDWVIASDNAKYVEAFSSVGGDPIDLSAGTFIPAYAFLRNGWRIRPQEASHTLAVTNGILLVDGGGDPFINTIGSFIVRINYQQPVQAITVATSGGSGLTAAQVWAYVLEVGLTAEQMMRLLASVAHGKSTITDNGNGTATVRFRDLGDTKNRIVASMDGSERISITRDAT